jgi:hypothetical protein
MFRRSIIQTRSARKSNFDREEENKSPSVKFRDVVASQSPIKFKSAKNFTPKIFQQDEKKVFVGSSTYKYHTLSDCLSNDQKEDA